MFPGACCGGTGVCGGPGFASGAVGGEAGAAAGFEGGEVTRCRSGFVSEGVGSGAGGAL